VITGTYQRGLARSRISQTASSGTDVPTWSGEEISTLVPATSWGASMIPAASATRTAASRPVAVPLASRAANSTARA